MRSVFPIAGFVLVLLGACDPGAFDRLMRGATPADGGMDAGASDAGPGDAGARDGGELDAGELDGSTRDGSVDAGELEGGAPDAGDAGTDSGPLDGGDDSGMCVGQSCGECEPGTRSCIVNIPNECSRSGQWQAEAACSAASPVCVGAGECRCYPGASRCGGGASTQPQVCSTSNEWVDIGAACSNCFEGRCPTEGCTMARAEECGAVGCHCASGDCSGGFCAVGDGCTAERHDVCAFIGCGCVDGGCSGGACAGNGCTGYVAGDCNAKGCSCSLQSCVATAACTD